MARPIGWPRRPGFPARNPQFARVPESVVTVPSGATLRIRPLALSATAAGPSVRARGAATAGARGAATTLATAIPSAEESPAALVATAASTTSPGSVAVYDTLVPVVALSVPLKMVQVKVTPSWAAAEAVVGLPTLISRGVGMAGFCGAATTLIGAVAFFVSSVLLVATTW